MHVAFFVLLGSSLTRFLLRHPDDPATLWVITFAGALATLYVLGPVLGPKDLPGPRVPRRATTSHKLWLAAVMAIWVTLVILAPSFGWCAVPLFYTGLRTLRTGAAILLVVLITVFVVAAQVQLRVQAGFDPNLLFAPPAVAAVATAMFVHSQRQATRLQSVIADLVRTRRQLAAIERREGTLAERQRLSMEIHDTLAQGLTSQQMLLQAADRVWDTDPDTAHAHVRTAESFAERNLAEARRFVHDLAPADLAGGVGLEEALYGLAERESQAGLHVHCRIEGGPAPLPDRVQGALLRIAQGALANVKEHAAARTAVLTLVYFDDQVVLDVADDGRGFDPAKEVPSGVRGHGLPAIRARVAQLGGTLTIESAPGDGTVLSAAIPLESRS
ncbi:sensor histidine kinase [Streptomyces cavernicola]|uniref:Oxygen sensor histidine kinase NreB n=1 Tax=Streptomyces cavernicola TaxID=3043613 RepID=A0ABT6SGM9_9ACTN|nr:sensor histidine kinase [Streptomyces sp. B-S-A6]MDI3407352.1 sensor histidine kinase [Streptomyces sp. B-S-A6]